MHRIFYLEHMKQLLFALGLLPGLLLNAQSFNSPESVDYDAAGGRWLVGQNGSGLVHVLSPATNTLSAFASGIPSGPHGIETVGDTVFVCDGANLKGFNRLTGAQVINENLGATFLNGITSDGGANLFITDFSAKKIYRFNRLTLAHNIMVTGLVKSPNGIYYDGPGNRCVFVNWGSNTTIMAMSLSDSTTTVLATPGLSNIDGITRDAAGNWYVTSWGNQSLMKFDPAFANAPVAVLTGLSNPADIDINTAGDSIGIPNSGNANNVVFFTVSTTVGLNPMQRNLLVSVFPNPASDVVRLQWAFAGAERVVVYSQTGQCYGGRLQHSAYWVSNRNELELNSSSWPRGAYVLALIGANGEQLATRQVIVN